MGLFIQKTTVASRGSAFSVIVHAPDDDDSDDGSMIEGGGEESIEIDGHHVDERGSDTSSTIQSEDEASADNLDAAEGEEREFLDNLATGKFGTVELLVVECRSNILPAGLSEAIARAPLRSLTIDNVLHNEFEHGEVLAQVLASNSTLRSFALAGVGAGPDFMEAFSHGLKENDALEELSLVLRCGVSHSLVVLAKAIEHHAHKRRLKHLDLLLETDAPTDFDGPGALWDALAKCRNLEDIRIGNMGIYSFTGPAISRALRANSKLLNLELQGVYSTSYTGPPFFTEFADALGSTTELRSFTLTAPGMMPTPMQSIIRSLQKSRNLASLDLKRTRLCTKSAELIALHLVGSALERLELQACGLDDSAILIFSESVTQTRDARLTKLDLSFNNFGPIGSTSFARALAHLRRITDLDLSWNNLGVEGARALAAAVPSCQSLSIMKLSRTSLSSPGCEALMTALASHDGLLELGLDTIGIDDNAARSISFFLRTNMSLQRLCLRGNELSNDGAAAIAQALGVNQMLRTLDLSFNNIGDDGASALSTLGLCHNFVLSDLSLEFNKISDAGATAIATALPVCRIAKLNLRFNEFSLMEVFREVLPKSFTITALEPLGWFGNVIRRNKRRITPERTRRCVLLMVTVRTLLCPRVSGRLPHELLRYAVDYVWQDGAPIELRLPKKMHDVLVAVLQDRTSIGRLRIGHETFSEGSLFASCLAFYNRRGRERQRLSSM
ncbi:hypothetical protein DFJ73DRAFT_402778 [Zopfochytrium polystomum]|nr:hypothetical protein DFJ73DRAFT_402778 [Zopfochytrium polystomum]